MTVAAKPWMKFYPQDWRSDEKLRMCSLSARGLWMEMLAIMHRSERYGQLLISGKIPNDAQLAVQVGAMPGEVTALLAELREAEVFSQTSAGVIYSRRMTRDQKRQKQPAKTVKTGATQSFQNKGRIPAGITNRTSHRIRGALKPRDQRPETRIESPLPREWKHARPKDRRGCLRSR
jgi:hypothetical protein